MRRRALCVWLPYLPAERALKGRPDPDHPLGIVGEVRGALRLCSLNKAGVAAGLSIGMALSDARAILPTMATVPHDPERDAGFLRALARWAQRFTPLVAIEAEDCELMLETAGCAHLFGGEGEMLAEILAGLSRFGLTARLGLADTKGGAWALSRYGRERIAPPGETRRMIERLPVAALRLEAETCAGLSRMGLKTIADVARTPRASVARRFGVETVRRIDQALGVEVEPLSPVAMPAPYAVRLSLPEPIATTDAVMAGLERLLAQLCERLACEGLGARRLRLTVHRADGGRDGAEIGLMRPSRDAVTILTLFAKAVDALDAGFGIDVLRLEAVRVEPLAPAQITSGGAAESDALDALLSRIANRIGFEALERLTPAQSHIPERSWLRQSAAHVGAATEWPSPAVPRPVTLFPPEALTVDGITNRTPPMRFRWRGQDWRAVASQGPERITPEWWLDDPQWRTGLRDYWRVETACARHLWVYNTPEVPPETSALSQWFVQGVFA